MEVLNQQLNVVPEVKRQSGIGKRQKLTRLEQFMIPLSLPPKR